MYGRFTLLLGWKVCSAEELESEEVDERQQG